MQSNVNKALALANDNGTTKFKIVFDGKAISSGGKVKKNIAHATPQLNLINGESGTCIAVCLDLDAPIVSIPFLSPILHWMQPNLEFHGGRIFKENTPCLVDWLAPIPPSFSGPHRFMFVFYKQPSTWDNEHWKAYFTEPMGVWKRVNWDLDKFAEEAGLRDPIAASYFYV
ncbi:protease inhibitor (Tfs1) [Fusarium denticulatum]|uniref:Protease inhibitor (Tfs1) n=1 Tax=Fusarium denticulatum TaxID=48507 RepID=A0A8H5WQ86_9HYPO|nr:protease inhibitor (Tfs1) [Fusarium denticulatum]